MGSQIVAFLHGLVTPTNRRRTRTGLGAIESLEDRRVLSARAITHVAAEVRIASRVAKVDVAELDGGYVIDKDESDVSPLGVLDFISVIVKGKKVSVGVFAESDGDNSPSFKFKGKGDEVPQQGFLTRGKGKNKDVALFLDAPFIDINGDKILEGSIIIDGEAFSFTARQVSDPD